MVTRAPCSTVLRAEGAGRGEGRLSSGLAGAVRARGCGCGCGSGSGSSWQVTYGARAGRRCGQVCDEGRRLGEAVLSFKGHGWPDENSKDVRKSGRAHGEREWFPEDGEREAHAGTDRRTGEQVTGRRAGGRGSDQTWACRGDGRRPPPPCGGRGQVGQWLGLWSGDLDDAQRRVEVVSARATRKSSRRRLLGDMESRPWAGLRVGEDQAALSQARGWVPVLAPPPRHRQGAAERWVHCGLGFCQTRRQGVV